MKGNVIDLAVGVIIGGAFGKIVDSVVKDLIMPLVSAVIGSPDFSNLYLVIKGDVPPKTSLEQARNVKDAVIFAYGNFLTVFINFLLLAFIIFLFVKGINSLRRKHEEKPTPPPPPPAPSTEEKLLAEIRDLLKNK